MLSVKKQWQTISILFSFFPRNQAIGLIIMKIAGYGSTV